MDEMEMRDNIRSRLYRNTLTQRWLINRLTERGVPTDQAELSSILAGARKGPKPLKILNSCVEILDDYELLMRK